jgi:rubrerythrin
MNLHAIQDLDEEEDEDDFDEDEETPDCRECGEARWERRETGWFAEKHTIRFPGGNEDWETVDQEVENTDPWVCMNCGTLATDGNTEYIENNR